MSAPLFTAVSLRPASQLLLAAVRKAGARRFSWVVVNVLQATGAGAPGDRLGLVRCRSKNFRNN